MDKENTTDAFKNLSEEDKKEVIFKTVELGQKKVLINNYLKTEALKLLEKTEEYNNVYSKANKKFELLCTVYGVNKIEDEAKKEKTIDYIFHLGGEWLEDYKIKSSSYWNYMSPFSKEYLSLSYAESAYYADKKVAKWEKDKLKLEKKLAKAKNEGKIEKLKEKISKGDEKVKDDIEVAKARREAMKFIEGDKNYFSDAIFLMKNFEKMAVGKVIKSDNDNELISDLIYDATKIENIIGNKYYEYQDGRFYYFGEKIIQNIIRPAQDESFKREMVKSIQTQLKNQKENDELTNNNIDACTENDNANDADNKNSVDTDIESEM